MNEYELVATPTSSPRRGISLHVAPKGSQICLCGMPLDISKYKPYRVKPENVPDSTYTYHPCLHCFMKAAGFEETEQ